jgi:hypothetical protein
MNSINIFVVKPNSTARYIKTYYRNSDDMYDYIKKYEQDYFKLFGRKLDTIKYVKVGNEIVDYPYYSHIIPKEVNHICLYF